jgi:excisionase family DNA binding protein
MNRNPRSRKAPQPAKLADSRTVKKRKPVPPILPDQRWLSVSQVAVYFGVKDGAVYKWLRDGVLQATRILDLWKFDRQYIESINIRTLATRRAPRPERTHSKDGRFTS